MILAYKGTVAYIRVPFSFLSMKIDSLQLQKDLRVFVEVDIAIEVVRLQRL